MFSMPWEADFLGSVSFLKSLKYPLTYFKSSIQDWKIKSIKVCFVGFFFKFTFQRCCTLDQSCFTGVFECIDQLCFSYTGCINHGLSSCRDSSSCQGHCRQDPGLSPVRGEAQWDHSCSDKTVGIIHF